MPAADTPAGALVEPEVDRDVDATEQVTADSGGHRPKSIPRCGARPFRRRRPRTPSARPRHRICAPARGARRRPPSPPHGPRSARPFELAAVGAERMGELDDDAPLRSHAELAEIDPLDMKPSHSSRTRDQPVQLAAGAETGRGGEQRQHDDEQRERPTSTSSRRRGQRSPLSGRRRRSCSRTAAGASPRSALRRTWAAPARSRRGTAGSTGGRAGARRPAGRRGSRGAATSPSGRQRARASRSWPAETWVRGRRSRPDRGTDRLFVASFRIVIPRCKGAEHLSHPPDHAAGCIRASQLIRADVARLRVAAAP